ncbi:alpha/beta hydrolase [Microbacterium karelineae]|uniref:alpha/beta hydrolase n=1 Tax=Microbacterium karelineae TaxID=2654283 RepID=UPI0012EAE2F4|nr:alpha/beta hydrolase [Microbacterium karelineae]
MILRDIPYAQVEGFRPLSLDLHLPDVADPAIVVFLHGGGWRRGSRAMFYPGVSEEDSFGRIVAAGFAVASVDYRLSGEAIFPAQADDVAAALAWIRSIGAEEHGLDASRIVVWGESAGGHLAAMAAVTDPEIAGAVCWYAPTDLLAFPQGDEPETTREALLIGGSVASRPDVARRASPRHHLHAGIPPFHLAHGEDDSFVPAAQSTTFAEAVRAAGGEAELTLVPGADHMWKGLADPATVFDPAIDFVRRVTAEGDPIT